ncbi:Putative tRNA(His) guanylyltransferase [Picochlorum sp. SENEW3]|nr:Putative tRNA(His) guanylyltransferase [Picochlorum sp. SENEW3]
MANTKFEYVKLFEQDDALLQQCWIVVRLDGKGFTKFTEVHGFEKPHDERGLGLMNAAAVAVMKEFPDIRVAFGESDEYSFVFHKDAVLYGRRASKIISLITSCFSVSYVRMWSSFFPDTPLEKNPLFDGRVVLYPNLESLRDYLSWRQADTHINCQYNTCYWMLIKEGKSREEVQKMLRGTLTADKNEIMFQRGVNYNTLPAMFRKGSVVVWAEMVVEQHRESGKVVQKSVKKPQVFHEDIIGDTFWKKYPHVLQ